MKYTCPYIHRGLSFDTEGAKCCLSNRPGPVLQELNKNTKLDIASQTDVRKKVINMFNQGEIPECCQNCYQIKEIKNDSNENDKSLDSIDTLFISHWKHCNCGCIYCVYADITKGKHSIFSKKSPYYDVLPHLKELEKRELLTKYTTTFITGGECTVLSEFKNIIKLFKSILKKKITILSSCIDYSREYEELIKKDLCEITTSIDSGTRETYKRLKRVDKFNQVVKNLKKYIKKSPLAEQNIILKYIIIKGINDNEDELFKFLALANSLGIKRVQLDIDHRQNVMSKIPDYYYKLYDFFSEKAEEHGLCVNSVPQNEAIRDKGEIF